MPAHGPRSALALALAVLAGAALDAAPLSAQTPSETRVTWELGTGRGGWCLYFLMAPREAADRLQKGLRVVPASDWPDLVAPLRRVITDQPEYGSWIPAESCLWFSSGVTSNRRPHETGDRGRDFALYWWGIAATGEASGGKPALSQVVLATNSSGLKRQMELEFVQMERIEIRRDSVTESEDEEISYKLDRTVISFVGHPRPDSTLVPVPVVRSAIVKGDNNRLWREEFRTTPTELAGLSGSLRIQGKGPLAKALTASPIRMIGTVSIGGTGEVRFSTVP